MGELTHESLVEYLVEETYELVDAIEGGHPAEELKGELGDVLLQVVLHARLAEESGLFRMQDVVEALTAKMVRRNPHVFQPDGTLQESFPATVDEIIERWHAVKKQEKPERTSPFDGVPHHLPALAFAAKTLKRAEQAGSESRDHAEQAGVVSPGRVSQVVSASPGPSAALAQASPEPKPVQIPSTEAELGNFLLDVVGQSIGNGLDAERALRAAVLRFQVARIAPK
ncbi:hypothetical protein GCM10027402_11020 [Arthrobacter monumenti]